MKQESTMLAFAARDADLEVRLPKKMKRELQREAKASGVHLTDYVLVTVLQTHRLASKTHEMLCIHRDDKLHMRVPAGLVDKLQREHVGEVDVLLRRLLARQHS